MENKSSIKHIEFWVSDLKKSMEFYSGLAKILGWETEGDHAFYMGETKIYFREKKISRQDSLGPRHICFRAENRSKVDEIGQFLKEVNAKIIRGPVDVSEYSPGYYTVDFYDRNGYVLEVATKLAGR